jgi:lysozyme family protein
MTMLLDHSFEKLEEDYRTRFARMTVLSRALPAAQKQVAEIVKHKVRYLVVEKQTNVPWYWTGIMHIREAGEPPNFSAWIHNGDPMFNHLGKSVQTVHVPRGRPLNPRVSWEQGAVDAFEEVGILGIKVWTPERCAWAFEKTNGFGYRDFHNRPSPYLWGETSEQQPGKYVRDREFDSRVMDEQLGTMAVLKLILEMKGTV